MTQQRKRYSAEFKFQIALEAAKGVQTMTELSSQHGVHSNQIGQWKQELLQAGPTIFAHPHAQEQREQTAREAELYEQIGRLKMELEWLKKKSARYS
jgi:transposase-like protein